MKKTIITLLALAGIAAAAETTQVLWSLDFTGTDITSSYAEGVSLSGVPGTTNDGLTLNAAPVTLQQTGSILTYNDEFIYSVTLKVNSLNVNYPEFVGMGELNNDGSYKNGWKAGYYKNENYFCLDWDGFSAVTDSTTKHSGNLTITTGETITLTLHNDGNGTLTMYVGDAKAGSSTVSEAELSREISVFSLGGRINGKTNNNSNITVYSANLSKIVPEPTTATLSLLALCGLAARRRRK